MKIVTSLSFQGQCREALEFYARVLGGKVGMAFAPTFWSPGFGTFTDRFGIPWMINTNPAADWKPGG